ncbi:MAG TPA: GNAT family N-acetyltransferase [Nitrospiraceae bacterium]|nr:GNAT family N-acetyltransferase [Nitrospiraceae bacterium]
MLTVRPAMEKDFDSILEIQREAFGEYAGLYATSAWTTETLDDLKRDAQEKKILVAEWEGTVVGSVRFWVVGGVCVIRLLSVKPSHQGRGIGQALMREIEQRATGAHKLYVCTMLRTSRNVHLFLKLGYRPESLLPNHYNRMDMICFAKYPQGL